MWVIALIFMLFGATSTLQQSNAARAEPAQQTGAAPAAERRSPPSIRYQVFP